MQIAGTTSQTTTTAATTTPVQPLASPTAAASQAGNIVMVLLECLFHLHSLCIHIILTCSDYGATLLSIKYLLISMFSYLNFNYILLRNIYIIYRCSNILFIFAKFVLICGFLSKIEQGIVLIFDP